MFLSALLFSIAAARIVTGDPMPVLKGSDLAGKAVTLPDAVKGKVALLAFGFTYDSRHPVEAWVKEFRKAYSDESKVTFFEIPMIGGMGRLGKWFIDAGMRKGTPKADHDHVMTIYGGTGPWKERLGVADENAAYLLLLDREGRVAWAYGGPYSEPRLQELRNITERILTQQN